MARFTTNSFYLETVIFLSHLSKFHQQLNLHLANFCLIEYEDRHQPVRIFDDYDLASYECVTI